MERGQLRLRGLRGGLRGARAGRAPGTFHPERALPGRDDFGSALELVADYGVELSHGAGALGERLLDGGRGRGTGVAAAVLERDGLLEGADVRVEPGEEVVAQLAEGELG